MKRKWCQSILAIILEFLFIISPISSISSTVSAGQSTGKKYSFNSSGGGVTISLREVKENNWWYEYYITVKNTTNKPVKNWSLTVNVSDISKYSQAFDCKGKW